MDSKAKISEKNLTGPRYWKSLDDLVETPAFDEWLHREFPQGAAEAEGINRRHFLKIMGASFGLAGFGLAGCRQPEQTIVPYSKQPENTIPGVPKFFATSLPGSVDSIPLTVETHASRPTKIEGNSNYKPYGGSTTTYAQASILDLYDPDRAQQSKRGAQVVSKETVHAELAHLYAAFEATKGEGLALLLDGSSSPSRARLIQKLQKKLPKATVAQYEPIDLAAADRAASDLLGEAVRPLYNLKKAKRVLALDSDFANTASGNILNARGFADGRRVYSKDEVSTMNRLYAVESGFSVTGGMADHRLRLATAHMPALLAAITAKIGAAVGMPASVLDVLKSKAAKLHFKDQDAWMNACVDDLLAHKGESLILVGEHFSKEVQQIALLANRMLEAVGKAVEFVKTKAPAYADIRELALKMGEGSVKTLFILGGNPVYNASADLAWKKLQSGVDNVIYFGTDQNETAAAAGLHIAATHYLESWGDGRTLDGTMVPVQPMILPLFEGLMELEVLARLMGETVTDAYDIARATFAELTGKTALKSYEAFLHNGFEPDTAFASTSRGMRSDALLDAAKALPVASDSFSKDVLEVRIVPSAQTFDGRYANNGWLQEMPEPMNKTCWDNTINISPRLAQELGFNPETVRWLEVSAAKANNHLEGRQVAPIGRLTVGGVTLEGPVNIQPGLSNYTVTIAMGYGRQVAGRVGKDVGFNVFPIFTAATLAGATLEITKKTYDVANTQEHWSMEGRAIVREANTDYYEEHPDFVNQMGMESHTPPVYGKHQDKPLAWKVTNQPRGGSAYETPTFTAPQQWGMSIDLNVCTGCNQCAIACQAENSIPIVGKEQVVRGREMHWIRLDRYYTSGSIEANKNTIPEDPQVSLMPMNCQQCEMAPCEQVCPVNATVHDEQGLNVMAYNRCVGTRYCANNCPYKVRRFNFFDFNKREEGHYYQGPLGPNVNETQGGKLRAMQRNPDVTVRMRGVMEKCTYCQQRIEAAKINQKSKAKDSDDIKVPDGTIKTACQQACPMDAIAFGDLADVNTDVYKLKQSDRDYAVLGYLNTRPRTTYLARLRNPNKAMPDYKYMPLSQKEYKQASGHAEDHGNGHDKHATPAHDSHH